MDNFVVFRGYKNPKGGGFDGTVVGSFGSDCGLFDDYRDVQESAGGEVVVVQFDGWFLVGFSNVGVVHPNPIECGEQVSLEFISVGSGRMILEEVTEESAAQSIGKTSFPYADEHLLVVEIGHQPGFQRGDWSRGSELKGKEKFLGLSGLGFDFKGCLECGPGWHIVKVDDVVMGIADNNDAVVGSGTKFGQKFGEQVDDGDLLAPWTFLDFEFKHVGVVFGLATVLAIRIVVFLGIWFRHGRCFLHKNPTGILRYLFFAFGVRSSRKSVTLS